METFENLLKSFSIDGKLGLPSAVKAKIERVALPLRARPSDQLINGASIRLLEYYI